MFWFSWLFAARTRLWGAMILGACVLTGLIWGIYLQYNCLYQWQKPEFGLKARGLAAAGDGTEAIFLFVLDIVSTNRAFVSGLGLSCAGIMRILAKIFSLSTRWTISGIILEISAEFCLCCLRWRLVLAESRWGVAYRSPVVSQGHQIAPAEQVCIKTGHKIDS